VQFQVKGTTMPMLDISLDAGEHVVSTHGGLAWMSASIEMSQTTKAGKGGIIHGLKRALGGGGILLTKYEAHKQPGSLTFGSKVPGTIFPLQVVRGSSFMVHREGWICGTPGIQPSVGFQHSFKSSLFGGEGFVLEKLEGEGTAWIELAGETEVRDLQPGEQLLVHPGHVGVFQHTVKFEVRRMKGIINRHFGDDGFHLVHLVGPGRVWLQSMPLPLLAGALRPLLEDE
jgi:uncharacterized protein (TIGR00266 family)